MSAQQLTHPFHHIMPGPYRFIGLSTPESRESLNTQRRSQGLTYTTNTQGGGTCAHCGTAISVCCVIEGAEGRFKVGSTCIQKLSNKSQLFDKVRREINQRKRDRRNERHRQQFLQFKQWLITNESELKAKPHPKGWQGKTLLNYLEWYSANAGNAKIIAIARQYGFTPN